MGLMCPETPGSVNMFLVNAKDFFAKHITSLHEAIFKATKGRVLGNFYGMPVVLLETTGRKSGKQRRTMLTTPVHDDSKVVLVASYGGDDRHPSWFVNARANPDVVVTMQGETRKMRAHVASPEEKAELWPKVTGQYKGYAGYQTRTDRDIPLLVLEP
jgi:deazaflavin-dependent oxidoreductase (nitroreductase family)